MVFTGSSSSSGTYLPPTLQPPTLSVDNLCTPLSRLMTPGSSRTNLRKRRNLQCCLPWLGLLALEVRGERLEVRLQPAG